jgi:photosystem II stability/assembly factor-like uncharacterized protein
MRASNLPRSSSIAWVLLIALLSPGCRGNNVTPPLGPAAPVALPQTTIQGGAAAPRWSNLGPRSVGGWSGKVNAFAYDPGNPKVMYLGGGWGNTPRESPSQMGLYKTEDGGTHWRPIDDGLTNPDGTISSAVNGLWLDPKKPRVVLASTEFGGTFRSTDAGATWRNVDGSEATRFSLAGSTLYLASRRGVLASDDDGATWRESLRVSDGATTVVTVANRTYAGTASGDVYRLSGARWTRMGHPGTGAIHDIALDPFNRKTVYANVDDTGIWNQALYGSIDGGRTWQHIRCRCAVGAQAIAFSLVVPHRLYLGEDSGYFVYLTADGNPDPKTHFATQPFGSDTRYIIPVAGKNSGGDACYILQDQGLAYAPSCSSGSAPRLSAIPNTLAYSFALTPNRDGMLVPLQDNGAGKSSDAGKTWKYLPRTDEGGEVFVDPFDAQRCYFAHPDQGLFVSSDACGTFAKAHVSGIESLAFSPAQRHAIYAITDADRNDAAVSLSTDGGMTWSPSPWHFTMPYQIVVSPKDPKTILVAAGTATSRPHLYYTHDGGAAWHKASGLGRGVLPNATIYFPTHGLFAAFDPHAPATIVVADHNPVTNNVEIYRSTNGAESFAHVSTLEQPPTQRPWPNIVLPAPETRSRETSYYATRFYANRLVFNPQARKRTVPAVVLTTRFGAFLSNDTGSTWQRIDTKAIAHHFIGAAWNDGYVYLASFGQGVIKSATPLSP